MLLKIITNKKGQYHTANLRIGYCLGQAVEWQMSQNFNKDIRNKTAKEGFNKILLIPRILESCIYILTQVYISIHTQKTLVRALASNLSLLVRLCERRKKKPEKIYKLPKL